MSTTQGNMWFHYLTTAYVQTGEYEITETMKEGKHHAQGIKQVLGNTTVSPYPEHFIPEWATTVGPNDKYDKGAYGLGIPVHERTLKVPRVRRVHLLYFFSLSGTAEERTLVQVPADSGDYLDDLGPNGLGLLSATGERIVWSTQEYVEKFKVAGFNRFGKVFPTGMSASAVSELRSFTGEFVEVVDAGQAEAPATTVTVYFSPLWINGARPHFDFVYLQVDETDIQGGVAGVASRLIRWIGGVTSENIAPLSRDGGAVLRDGYRYDVDGQVIESPLPKTITIDGVTYTDPSSYNLGYTRY